jgi:hypothetical protein
MDRQRDAFEEFREGMAAGHEAARDGNLLYAAGFLIGFVWGALFEPRTAQRRSFEQVA